MTRGRKRKHDPTIPAHIDQGRLPLGIYWHGRGRGRWYVIEVCADGTRKKRTVATSEAKLSDLHRIIEERAGVDRASLAWLLDAFAQSSTYGALAPTTRKGYAFYRDVAKHFPTRLGKLGDLSVARFSPPLVQRVVDNIASDGKPTKANALLRYLRRVFAWGVNRGHCGGNPAAGVEQAKERKARIIPAPATVSAIVAFCRIRGERKAHTKGSVAPYLWIVIELAYLCRLRGIEVVTLTDAHARADGVLTNRRKGSRDSLVEWTPRLRTAWDAAIDYRKAVTPKNAVVPIDPGKRPIIVSQDGRQLRKSSLDTAWQRMMHAAIDEGVIAPEHRFSLHGMKRRGITDTPGTRGDKQLASGHKTEAMLDVYDSSVPSVRPAGESVE